MDMNADRNEKSTSSLVGQYAAFGISQQVLDFAAPVLEGLRERFDAIDETAEYNQLRVIRAMQESHIGEAHLKGTTGYGYDDVGRDTLSALFAEFLGAEKALVRPQITSGTHAGIMPKSSAQQSIRVHCVSGSSFLRASCFQNSLCRRKKKSLYKRVKAACSLLERALKAAPVSAAMRG